MRAAVFYGIGDLRLATLDDPQPGPGEIVLRVGAAGICGTDVRIFANGHHRIPPGTARVLGHELAGEVAQMGTGVEGLAVGDRVALAPNVGCGTCRQCVSGWTNLCPDYQAYGISLDGGFAEQMRVTAETLRQGNVVRLPASLPYTWAALAEPMSCCLNGQEAVALGVDDVVLIVGAGPIGLMHVLLARLRGARSILVSELAEERRQMAAAAGADVPIDPGRTDLGEAVRQASGGRGADVIIVAAPSAAAQAEALELAAARGRVNFFGGLPKDQPWTRLNANLIHYKQLMLTGTTGSNVRQYRATVELIAAGRLPMDRLVGDTLPLERVQEGVERTRSGKEMRLLLSPGD